MKIAMILGFIIIVLMVSYVFLYRRGSYSSALKALPLPFQLSPVAAAPTRGDFRSLYQGQSVDDLVIQFMQEHDIAGLELAIVQAPYITRVVGYGLADKQTRQLVATNTMFNIGSMARAFTAVAVMQLCEDGKLVLQDGLEKYFSSVPAQFKKCSIAQVLTNSAGLPDLTGCPGYQAGVVYDGEQIFTLLAGAAPLHEPGVAVSCNVTSDYILRALVAQVSGMGYAEFVMKNQIERLGLKHTFCQPMLSRVRNEQAGGFKHVQFKHDPIYINPTEVAAGHREDGSPVQGATAAWEIYSTAEDISLWDIALAGDILLKQPESRAFLYSPIKLKDSKTVPSGICWFFPGRPGLMHVRGETDGYSNLLVRFTAPGDLLCVTLLTNKGNVPGLDLLARRIAGAYDAKLASPRSAAWSVVMQSPYSVGEIIDRIQARVNANGGTIFSRINHSSEATKASLELRPTEVLMLGNPKAGTALMQASAPLALDLPLRVMAWQDAAGQTWLSFTDPRILAEQYHSEGSEAAANKIYLALLSLCCGALEGC